MINLKNPQNIAEFLLQSFRNVNVSLILNVFMNQVHHLSVEIDEVKFICELEDSSEEGRDFRQISFVCFQHFRSMIQMEKDVIRVREGVVILSRSRRGVVVSLCSKMKTNAKKAKIRLTTIFTEIVSYLPRALLFPRTLVRRTFDRL